MKTAGEVKVFDLMGNMLGKVNLNAGATVAELKASLKNAGYRNGAYVITKSPTWNFSPSTGLAKKYKRKPEHDGVKPSFFMPH